MTSVTSCTVDVWSLADSIAGSLAPGRFCGGKGRERMGKKR
jgi:hypothetical protein